jgi:uncharacterized membrane protein YedE/YeeE
VSRVVLAAFLSGALVGAGLAISSMTDRQVVLGFLDFAGDWNPTLAFVMGGAVAVTAIAFRLVLRRGTPALGDRFRLPQGDEIDRRLLTGAAIFGIGWGLAGFCPGPALVGVAAGLADAWVFLPAMVVGSFFAGRLGRP